MIAIITVVFLVVPIISVPLLIIGACYDKKYRMIYLLFLSFVLAIIAYNWLPSKEYDLYRYHLILDKMRNIDFKNFLDIYITQKEIISNFLFYLISKLSENNSMLEFIITFMTYGIIFYIVQDYAKIQKYNNLIFIISLLYIISSIRYLSLISGIRNMFAVVIFALGIYLEYVKKDKKWKCNILYISTIFIHISSLLVVAIKFIYTYIFKEKINIGKIILIGGLFLLPEVLFTIIERFGDISIFTNIQKMYIAYFINGEQFDSLTGGNILLMNILRAVLCILIYILYKNKDKDNKLNNYTFLLLIVLITITTQSKEFIKRYIGLCEILSMPMLMDYYSKSCKNTKIIIIMLSIMISALFIYLQIKGLITLDFGNLFTGEQLISNVYTIFNK